MSLTDIGDESEPLVGCPVRGFLHLIHNDTAKMLNTLRTLPPTITTSGDQTICDSDDLSFTATLKKITTYIVKRRECFPSNLLIVLFNERIKYIWAIFK